MSTQSVTIAERLRVWCTTSTAGWLHDRQHAQQSFRGHEDEWAYKPSPITPHPPTQRKKTHTRMCLPSGEEEEASGPPADTTSCGSLCFFICAVRPIMDLIIAPQSSLSALCDDRGRCNRKLQQLVYCVLQPCNLKPLKQVKSC